MRFASLGSGSHGNCTVVQHGDTCLMVDLGFTLRETERRLGRLELSPEDVSAIVVTHEHGDHVHGVGPFSRKYRVPVHMSHGTWDGCKQQELAELHLISAHQAFDVGALHVAPVPVPHDTREPCQYLISGGDRQLGVLSDLGHVTRHVLSSYAQCDAMMLECNHDPDMLANGPYHQRLKERVGGDLGHLNNAQAAELLAGADLEKLQHLVICHVSEKNNTEDLALAEILGVTTGSPTRVCVADQADGVPWLGIK